MLFRRLAVAGVLFALLSEGCAGGGGGGTGAGGSGGGNNNDECLACTKAYENDSDDCVAVQQVCIDNAADLDTLAGCAYDAGFCLGTAGYDAGDCLLICEDTVAADYAYCSGDCWDGWGLCSGGAIDDVSICLIGCDTTACEDACFAQGETDLQTCNDDVDFCLTLCE